MESDGTAGPGGSPYAPSQVLPPGVASALRGVPSWFLIGGQAVRCLTPYRPSRDADIGVATRDDLDAVLGALSQAGDVDIRESSDDTVHLSWNGVGISVFVAPQLAAFAEGSVLSVTGILAPKLHAILDRGARRDFFDLYVTLQTQRLGLAEALHAMRTIHGDEVRDDLLLRALTYFDDAEREAPLPGEGPDDFATIKQFFLRRAGDLLVPPGPPLKIQSQVIDVAD